MKALILSLGFSFALAGVAAAQTLTFEFGNPIVEETTEINQTGSLGLFDTNLGTLTGAVLTIFGSGTTSLSVTSAAATTVNARVTIDTALSFGSSLDSVNSLVSDPGSSFSLVYTTGINSYTPGQVRNFGPLTYEDKAILDLAGILGDLQAPGGGTFNITGTSLTSQSAQGGGGNLSIGLVTNAGIGARIDYSYIPVPEPSSSFLVLLPVLGLLRRRR